MTGATQEQKDIASTHEKNGVAANVTNIRSVHGVTLVDLEVLTSSTRIKTSWAPINFLRQQFVKAKARVASFINGYTMKSVS